MANESAEETQDTIVSYAREYSAEVWPTHPFIEPDADDLWVLAYYADGYADAHVNGEHGTEIPCEYSTARECGMRRAAEHWVETH